MPEALRIPVYSQDKQTVGDVELPEGLFDSPRRSHLLYEMVKMQLANRRAGTASTKTRAFVSGGGKKPWRQKGTGRARQGSTRATQWVGGATAFGPQPRDYSYRLPRSARREAVASALSEKHRSGSVLVVDRLEVASGKTRDVLKLLEGLGIERALIVSAKNEMLERGARNLERVKVTSVAGLNVRDLLHYSQLVLTREALDQLKERFAP